MKYKKAESVNWIVRNQEFTTGEVRLAIKGKLHKSMHRELDNHPEDYCYFTYENWCDLMSKIKVKDERKKSAAHIKKTASTRAASISDRKESVRIPRKKKVGTGVLSSNKSQKRRTSTTV